MFVKIKSLSFKKFIKKNIFDLFIIFIFFFLTNLVELFGIYLIIPVAYFLIGEKSELINFSFLNYLSIEPINIIYLFFGIYIIKFIFSIFSYWFQYFKIYQVQNKLSLLLLNKQFKAPFLNWNNKSNSQLIQMMINETDRFCNSFLMPLIILISEITFLIILISLLIFFYGIKTLFLIFFLSLIILIYYKIIIKNVLENVGLSRLKHDKLRIKVLNDIILSFKEIKIFLKQTSFIKYFEKYNTNYVRTLTILGTFSQLPRIILETLIVIVFIIFVLFFNNEGDLKLIIPHLAFFLGILFRLMPSVNRIITSSQNIHFSKPSYKNIDQLFLDLEIVEADTPKMQIYNEFQKLELKNISFSYEQNKVLSDINLTLEKGKIYGIKGESGSGKSTFVNMICGLIKPEKGKIYIDEKLLQFNNDSWLSNIAYVSQNSLLLNDTLLNNIIFEYNSKNIDEEKFQFSIDNSKINELINSMKNGRDAIIGDRGALISSGQSQRINIARLFYSDKDLLILDEATNAIDKDTEEEILNNIKNLNQTSKKKRLIILISHKTENLKICDYVLEMKDKKLVKN